MLTRSLVRPNIWFGMYQDKCKIKEPPSLTLINLDCHVYILIIREGLLPQFSGSPSRTCLYYTIGLWCLINSWCNYIGRADSRPFHSNRVNHSCSNEELRPYQSHDAVNIPLEGSNSSQMHCSVRYHLPLSSHLWKLQHLRSGHRIWSQFINRWHVREL